MLENRFIHLYNTDFEHELVAPNQLSFAESWSKHPLCLQLQFLPLLFADPEECVAISALPDQTFLDSWRSLPWRKNTPFPECQSLDTLSSSYPCLPWGASAQARQWAETHHLSFFGPKDFAIVREVNSKAFSFGCCPLPQAALLFDASDLVNWKQSITRDFVLKRCFGFAGQHNKIAGYNDSEEHLIEFCQKEWKLGRPVLAEPWLEKVVDFSTQWFLNEVGELLYIGATRFVTDAKGRYQGTYGGPEELLFSAHRPFLEEHKQVAKEAGARLYEKGFFGYFGVDALLYQTQEGLGLHPLVEINARQTVSLAILKIQKKWFPDQIIYCGFKKVKPGESAGLLPSSLSDYLGHPTRFHHNFFLEIVA